jgi:hypothetical protein
MAGHKVLAQSSVLGGGEAYAEWPQDCYDGKEY